MAYRMAGITEPRKQIHVVEPYDPFSYKELHHLEGLLLAARARRPSLPPTVSPSATATCRSAPRAG